MFRYSILGRRISSIQFNKQIQQQENVKGILQHLKQISSNDLKSLNIMDVKSINESNKDFLNHLNLCLNKSFWNHITEYQKIIQYLNIENINNIINEDEMLTSIFQEDKLKFSILKYMTDISNKSSEDFFENLNSEVLLNESLSKNQKNAVILKLLMKFSQITKFKIEQDIQNLYQMKFNELSDVYDSDKLFINKKIMVFFETEDEKLFEKYLIKVKPEIIDNLILAIEPRNYDKLFSNLLNCNICLDFSFKKSKKFDELFKYLSNKSTTRNNDLACSFNWKYTLQKLFYIKDSSDCNTSNISNFLTMNSEVLNESYFKFKLLNMYSFSMMSKIIFKYSKKNKNLTNFFTFKIIKNLSKDLYIGSLGNEKNLMKLTEINQQNIEMDDFLKYLINIFILKYSKIKNKKIFLNSLLETIFNYTINKGAVDSSLMFGIFCNIIQDNKANTKLSLTNFILLMIVYYREKGLTDKSLKLINILINNMNGKIKMLNENNSVVLKDLLVEFLFFLKLNYPDNPKIFLSYYLTLMSANNLKFYYDNYELNNSFTICNELGLIKLVYENDLNPINLENSQEFDYYQNSLLKCNLKNKSLQNLRMNNESLSIFYSLIFTKMIKENTLDSLLLKKMFDRYVELVAKCQKITKNDHEIFGEKIIKDTILTQFINMAINMKRIELANYFLVEFLNKVKISNLKVKIFERLILKNSLLFFKNDQDLKSKESINQILALMDSKFNIQDSFFVNFSSILIHYNSDIEKSHEIYNRLIETDESNFKDFRYVKHLLLIQIAHYNNWKLPTYLQDLKFEQLDVNREISQLNFGLDNNDLLEFENDKLEDRFDDSSVHAGLNGNNQIDAANGNPQIDVAAANEEAFKQLCLLLTADRASTTKPVGKKIVA